MNADDFLDAPSADDFLGDAPATTTKRKPIIGGRGNAPTRAPVRFESVLQQPGNAEAFAAAPDPSENARALFNALKGNPELAKSPMYAAGAAALEQQATGEPSAAVSAFRRNEVNQRRRAQKDRDIANARAQTDAAFGENPVVQAIAAPGRRLLSGAASVVGGVAGIPQLFGSDLGRETADAASMMSAANMPADPGIADEVLAGVGQVGPMIGGAAAVRAALAPILGEAAATAIATSASGAAGGALTGGEVMRDLEFRGDLSESEKRQRAGLAALFSGVTGKYADRFLLPGADKAATGVLNAGGRAFVTEGGQEMLDQMGQNVATNKDLGEGALRAGLVGGLVGGGTRVATEVGSDATQLANAINADAQAMANQPTPQTVWTPTESRVAPPLPPPAPAPIPAPAAPAALGYDPSVKAGPDIMVAGQDGTVRPMTSDEFLDAEDTKQQGIDTGLTPDVRRAQENRSDVTDVEPKVEPDLLKRLIASGWRPPENTAAAPAAAEVNPDAAPDDVAADFESLYQQDVKDGIRSRLGLTKGDEQPGAAMRYAESPLIRGIAASGGIEKGQMSDTGVDGKRQTRTARVMPNPYNVDRRPLFRVRPAERVAGEKLPMRGDMLVEHLVQNGYLSQQEVEEADANGVGSSEELAYDILRRELESPGSVRQVGERADPLAGRARAELEQQASAIGFDITGMDEPQIAASLKRIERRRAKAGKDFDARGEVRLERQAVDDVDAFSDEQLASLDAAWLGEENVTLADAMMALGFDPAEIDTYGAREAENRGRAQASGGDAGGAAARAGATDEGSEGRPAIESYSPGEVVGRQDRAAQAGRDEQRQQQDTDNRARADAQRGDFTLTGSDRAADANPDQETMFSKAGDPFAIADTRQRRKAVLEQLGEGWTAGPGMEGARDLFEKRAGRVRAILMAQRTVDGNFYVGSYDSAAKRGNNTNEPKTLQEAKAAADKFLGAAPAPSGKQDAMFSAGSTGSSTASTLRTELRDRFGDVIDRLEKRGFLKLWDSVGDYNAAGQFSQLPPEASGGVQGMYSHSTGKAHLFGDGIEPGQAVAVMLHEVGEHASMKAMLGDARYKDLVRRAHRLVADGDEIAETAMMRIPDDTPRKFFDSELVAYMIEEAATREGKMSPAARSWLADVLAAVRAWFYQTGFAKNLERYGVKLDLTPKDIAALAVRAVRWQAEQGGETQTQGEPAMASVQNAQMSIGKTAGPVMDTLRDMETRVNERAFRRWLSDLIDNKQEEADALADDSLRLDYLDDYLREEHNISVRDDGLIEFYKLTPDVRRIVGDRPVVLLHHTASGIEAKVRKEGLHPGGKSVNRRSARAVFLTTEASGPAVNGYHHNAVQAHGGDRVTYEVKVKLRDLQPDPDDADIRSGATQFIADSVAPEDILFSDRGAGGEQFSRKPAVSATGSNATAGQLFGPQPWSVAEPGTWDNIVRTMQNNKVDLKRVTASIEERFGRVPDSKDAYLSEELYHGKVSARVEKLHTEAVEPILRKIAVAGKNFGVTLDDVNRYLHARHAPERNAAMAAINPGMANNTALSGMSDADAAQAMQEFGRAGKTPALDLIAKDIDKLLGDTRTNLVADGLEEAGTVQAWEQAYKHYVPLMRDVENAPAKGKGFNVKGPEAKRAMGSNRQAVNILANIVTQAETAAIRAEKAEVGRTLLQMAKAYPNADFWKVDSPPTKPRINPTTGLVERSAVDPLYQTADNVVMVKEYGATRFIVFNEDNERAMAVAKAMKNLEVQQVPKLLRWVGAGTRFMASLLTQRNPEFWFTNFARDLQGSAIQMNGTDAEGLQGKVLGYLPKAMAGMRNVARATGKSTQWTRYAEEMKEAGGTTGYMQMFENSDDRMKDLQKEVDRMGQGKADPRKLARSLLEFVDDYNDVIENGMRLAVFQAAREAGISTARAASIAKNITVNFNRKGTATPLVNSLYMFFNAGVQGSARLAEALATSNKARAVVGGLAGVAFVMDIVNRAIAGDDDETKRNRYDMISEFEKARNWIVMLPDGKYVKVPLPLGFHIFHNAGRLIADAFGRKDPRNAVEYGWAFASTVLDAFNPLGNVASVGQLLSPSVFDPAVQLAENKNFMGGKVYRDDDQGFGKTDPRPAYQRYFETTPDFWKAASKALNDITGGDKIKPGKVNIEPDILRHIWGAITGGPGRALDKSVDTVQAKARGEEITPARIPFAHRFLGEIGDRQQDSAYFEDLKRAAKAKDQFDYFVKNGRRQEAIEILKEIGDGDVARGRQVLAKFAAAKKGEMAINKRIKQLREQESDDVAVTEQMKALKQQRAAGRHRVLKNTAADDGE